MKTINTPSSVNPFATSLSTILASHARGQGETSKLEETLQLDQEANILHVAGLGNYPITANTRDAMFLKQLQADFKLWDDSKKHEFLDCLSGGFLGVGHRKVQLAAANERPASVSPLAKVSQAELSAEQYRRNAVSLQLDVKNVDILITLLDASTHITDKTTKAELSELLAGFTGLFFPVASQQVYEVKLQDEAKAAEKFKTLTEAGISNIGKTALGNFTGTVAFSDINSALAALNAGGYTITKSDNDLTALVVRLTFAEGAPSI